MVRTKQTARKSMGSRPPRGYRPARHLQEHKNIGVIEEESDRNMDSRETSSPELDASDEEEMDSEKSESASLANEDGSSAQEEDSELDAEEENLDDHSFRISPKHSYGANFDKDLQKCLSGKIDFAGNPCHFELLPSAPNPCLNINCLGSIGVPLSSREGKAISEFVDDLKKPNSKTNGTNSWAIDASLISFDNPQWTKFLRKTVAENVWSGLGIAPLFAPVDCILEKLVLYGPGPLNVSEQGDKDEDAFSKIVIQLPSAHVGGRVHFSHQTIDLAKHPFATSIMASYMSADLSFTPITESFRLALVYNLVSELPYSRPELPIESLMTLQLRHIFRTWAKEDYEAAPTRERFVYILEQRKTPLPRHPRRDKAKLTPRDQKLISCLRDVAEEFDMAVFSGQLHYYMFGESNEGAQDSWDCVEGDDYDTEEMSIVNMKRTSASFKDLVDSDGMVVDGAYVSLEDDDIAPLDFFAGIPPDYKTYEPAFGNLDYSFHRNSVLVVTQEEAEDVLSRAHPEYWLSRMETLDPAGPEQLDAKKLDWIFLRIGTSQRDQTLRVRLINLALKWKDLDLWMKTTEAFSTARDQNKFEDFVEAWNVFPFQRLVASLNTMLFDMPSTEHELNFVKQVENHASTRDRKDVLSWATERYTNVIAKVCSKGSHHVSEIVKIGQERGASFLGRILIPHLVVNPPNIDFIHALYYKLHDNASTIPNSHSSHSAVEGTEMTAVQVASRCLENALKQPERQLYGISSPRKLSLSDYRTFSRLEAAVRLYISSGRIQECTLPLRLLLHTTSATYKDRVEDYSRFVTDLRGWLNQKNHAVTTAPFKYFFAAVIGLHMQYLINSNRPNLDIRLRTFGCCGCEYCERINRYLHNPKETRFHDRIYAKERKHIEPFLANLSPAQYHIGPAYGYTMKIYLTITKNADLQTLQAWEAKVDAAKAYLSRIGTDAEIALLMDGEYPKLQESLEGVRMYTASRRFKKAFGNVTEEGLGFSPPTVASPSREVLTASSSNIQTQADNAIVPTKQKKRKTTSAENRPSKRSRIEQHTDHEIIDLTE